MSGLAGWRDYQHTQSVARIDQLGVPGFGLYLEPSRERDLIAALIQAGAREVQVHREEVYRRLKGEPSTEPDPHTT